MDDDLKISSRTLWQDLRLIREKSPLIHNITNYVVMNTTANALLAIGASPVMAHAIEEVEEMVNISHALVINIGTLSTSWIDSIIKAGKIARRKPIPIILDPVGSGATKFRTTTALKIINEISPTIIRGNASEIQSLLTTNHQTKGVDSILSSETVIDESQKLSKKIQCIIAISGAIDFIISRNCILQISNGTPMMTKVTGLGCTSTALIGAFAAVNSSPIKAAAHAVGLMGIAGELASKKSNGPGSLQMKILDILYNIKYTDIERCLKLKEFKLK